MSDLISKDAAAARAGICSRTLDNLTKKEGSGPTPYRFGTRVLFDPTEVDEWIATRRQPTIGRPRKMVRVAACLARKKVSDAAAAARAKKQADKPK